MDSPPYRAPVAPHVAPGAIDVHVRDMTATIAADVPLRAVQERLGQTGQWLPVDGDADASIGRLVEINSTGPLRLGYGAWRDLLLGVQFTNGRGELITAGGRTVKNVAGYDLTKLMVGQHGAFGRLVTVTTRVYARPDGAILARFDPDPIVVQRLLPTTLRPQWMAMIRDALWCGYLGDAAFLKYAQAQLATTAVRESVACSLDEDIATRASVWRIGETPLVRAAVPPAQVRRFADAAKLDHWTADPCFGIVLGSIENGAGDARRQQILAAAREFGGTVTFVSDPADGARLLAPSTTAGEQRIITQLKRAFDPDQTLPALPWEPI